MEFTKYDTLYYHLEPNLNNNIAAFDLDSTLIKTKSGKTFPKDKNDWVLLYSNKTKEYLQKLYLDNYSIVIITNQKGISNNKISLDNFIEKLENIKNTLNINFSVFISSADDIYRKPLTGIWKLFLEKSQIKIDYDKSFYVGDAAGRIYSEGATKRKDHSSDDLYFAYNIKSKFYIPEEFFKENITEYTIDSFKFESVNNDYNQFSNILNNNTKTLILLVGAPASGKSYLANNIFKEYVCINQDNLKTKKKCITETEKAMKNNNNIIIDNTNPTKETRQLYLDLANKYNYNKYIIIINIPKQAINYMNKYRVEKFNQKIIPKIAYNIYYKNYEIPTEDEANLIEYNNYFIDHEYKF